MSKWVWSVLLCMLVGCAGPEKSGQQLKLAEVTDVLTLRVSSEYRKYKVELKQVRISDDHEDVWAADEHVTGDFLSITKMEMSGQADVLMAPMITVEPNEWKTVKVAHEIFGYETTVEWLIDGELVEMPAHAGFVLKAKVEPQASGQVQVKGLLCRSIFDDAGEFVVRPFPFDALCNPGEWMVVYRKQSRWSDQAIQKFNGEKSDEIYGYTAFDDDLGRV